MSEGNCMTEARSKPGPSETFTLGKPLGLLPYKDNLVLFLWSWVSSETRHFFRFQGFGRTGIWLSYLGIWFWM